MHFALVCNSCWKNLSTATKELIAASDLVPFYYGWWIITEHFLIVLSTTLGYPGRSIHPAQHHWPDLSARLLPRTEARAASCVSFLWSSLCPSQKAEEGSQMYAGPLPEAWATKIMGDAIATSGDSWLICAFGFPVRAFLGSYRWTPLTIPSEDLDFVSRKEHFSFVLQVGSNYQ